MLITCLTTVQDHLNGPIKAISQSQIRLPDCHIRRWGAGEHFTYLWSGESSVGLCLACVGTGKGRKVFAGA